MDVFEGKNAIITGAASGIGRALAEQLAGRGASLVLADRNDELLAEAAKAITDAGGVARSVSLDVRDFEAVDSLVKYTAEDNGRLDYIFNNAGIGVAGDALRFSIDDWRSVIDTNLYGAVNGTFAAYPIMAKQGHGHIINTASMAGLLPVPGEISYVASKYGIVGFSNALWAEAAGLGVCVSVVCPGIIRTPIFHTTKMIDIDREKTIKDLPKGISAEECASQILRGVERKKPTIVVTKLAKVFCLLHRLIPALTMRLMKKRFDDFRAAQAKG
jgi:short-subunit dehydrogenase